MKPDDRDKSRDNASLEDANWGLLGEAIVVFAKRPRSGMPPLPHPLKRLPGPVILLAERFADSPAGPYISFGIGEPARLGLRPGFHFSTSVLNSANARLAGRQFWGFPHELGALYWRSGRDSTGFDWDDREIGLRAEANGRVLPMLLPLRAVQRRSDGPVVIPANLRAMVRRCRVEVTIPERDPLAELAGSHKGFLLSGMLLQRKRARKARGWLSTLRAPLRAPEPGVVGMTD